MKDSAFFKTKQTYLPRFSRIFTVRPFFWVISGLLCGTLASFLLWKQPHTSVGIPPLFIQIPSSDSREVRVKRFYEEWKRVVEARPDYRDGYVMLAWYAQKLGKTNEVHTYIQKAITLDPNYSIPEVFQVEK